MRDADRILAAIDEVVDDTWLYGTDAATWCADGTHDRTTWQEITSHPLHQTVRDRAREWFRRHILRQKPRRVTHIRVFVEELP